MRKPKNVVLRLAAREIYTGNNFQKNISILKSLVTQPDSRYEKIWEKTSTQRITYESGKVFLDNFRTCINVHGIGGHPTRRYKLPACPVSQKIEDGMMVELPLSCIPPGASPCRPSFLALTAHNWLLRYDYETGKLLEQVYLSPRYRFRKIDWNSEGETVVLKSTHIKATPNTPESNQELVAMAVFTLFPLEFVGMLSITKTIFGHDVTDAQLNQGCLLTMHGSGGMLRIYSFDRIVQKYRGEECRLGSQLEDGVAGRFPAGLPCNINITERPPALFEVRCVEQNLCLGGIRCHYIIMPHKSNTNFHVYDFETQQTAVIETCGESLEPDKCYFHGDGSSRVLHIEPSKLRVLRLHEVSPYNPAKLYCLQEEFSIKAGQKSRDKPSGEDAERYSSSGRRIKRAIHDGYVAQDMTEQLLHCVDYEDELDILAISTVDPDDHSVASVRLHDNQTGLLLKEMPLEEPWLEHAHNTITMDLDIIVHIVHAEKYHCYIYKLQRHDSNDDKNDNDNNKETVPTQSRRRRRTRAQPTLNLPNHELTAASSRSSSQGSRTRSQRSSTGSQRSRAGSQGSRTGSQRSRSHRSRAGSQRSRTGSQESVLQGSRSQGSRTGSQRSRSTFDGDDDESDSDWEM